jgi:hypothetical protein
MKKFILMASLMLTGVSFGQISTPNGVVAATTNNSGTTAGFVGIGTSTPLFKLHVKGDMYADNGWLRTSGNTGWYNQTWGGGFNMTDATWVRVYNGKSFYHNTGIMRTDGIFQVGPDGNRFLVGANGNVGIGTTTPSANLEIFKNLSASTLKISNNDPSSLNTELRLGGTNTFEKSAIISVPNSAGWWRQDLYFCLANGNNTSSVSISDAAMVIKSYNSGQFGNVGIGTTNPDQKLTVKGKIHAEEIIVDLRVPADYVFQKYYTGKSELKTDYTMPTLAEIESFTKKNHHLPNVPSAQEVQQNGVSLGQMSNALLQKVEELTLYAIEQNKELERLKAENANYKLLSERLSEIEKELKK